MLADLNFDDDELPTTGSIAEALGVSRDAVCYSVKRLGLQGRRAGNTRVFTRSEARRLAAELARINGFSLEAFA